MRDREPYDARCMCGSGMYLVNVSWIECVNSYCTYLGGSVNLNDVRGLR